jgi:predicted MFS family arabinose efflux permease
MTRKTHLFEKLSYTIVLGLTAKLLVDTSVQIFNPYLPIVSGGLGVSVVAMGRLVGLRNGMGLLAPFFGSLADRIGHRLVLQLGLLLGGIGSILIALDLGYPVLVTAMIMTGLGISIYAPNLHAYVSSKLHYTRRSRIMGIIEYSWALASIIGLSLSGFLIDTLGWNAPFFFIGCGMLLFAALFTTIPVQIEPRNGSKEGVSVRISPGREKMPGTTHQWMGRLSGGFSDGFRKAIAGLAGFFRLGPNARSAWAAIAVTGLNFYAITHILISHGAWLTADYQVSASTLGLIALVMGCFDWAASISVSVFGDRIGKRRSVSIGIAGALMGFLLLPFLNVSLVLATASIIIPRFFFEFAIVSNFPLLSEQVPEQRGKILSLSISSGLLGTTIAGVTGPWAWEQFGVWGLGPVSLVCAIVSFVLIRTRVRDAEEPGSVGPL